MHDAEVGQAFLPLCPDVAFHVGDLNAVLKQIGGILALHHNIGGHLSHGRQRPDPAAVLAIAPGGVIQAVGMDMKTQNHKQQTQGQQGIGDLQRILLMQIPLGAQRHDHDRQQQPGHRQLAAGDQGVHEAHKKHQHHKQARDQGLQMTVLEPGKHEAVVQADHPNGICGLVKLFLAGNNGDQCEKRSRRDRQNDLTPHLRCAIGPFQTDEQHNAGHCRADHAQHHQPCQHIFLAGIIMFSVFHSHFIIAKNPSFGNKKRKTGLLLQTEDNLLYWWQESKGVAFYEEASKADRIFIIVRGFVFYVP